MQFFEADHEESSNDESGSTHGVTELWCSLHRPCESIDDRGRSWAGAVSAAVERPVAPLRAAGGGVRAPRQERGARVGDRVVKKRNWLSLCLFPFFAPNMLAHAVPFRNRLGEIPVGLLCPTILVRRASTGRRSRACRQYGHGRALPGFTNTTA